MNTYINVDYCQIYGDSKIDTDECDSHYTPPHNQDSDVLVLKSNCLGMNDNQKII